MAQQDFNEEVALSFFAALVRTINEIEAAQPEPGFGSVFMDLLKRNLEEAIVGSAANGLDTRQSLLAIHKHILLMFTANDLTDLLDATD